MSVTYQSQDDTKASWSQKASILCIGNLPDLFSVSMAAACASEGTVTNLAENIGRELCSFEEFYGDIARDSSKPIRVCFF